MADHWKSTPSYWCKFCAQYVRDTPIERKNHEATGRHQGNIQRSLRELHKSKAREDRDAQRAKDEVARLNALVSGEKATTSGGSNGSTAPAAAPPAPVRSAAAERKARTEQLLAMGVAVPEELRREVTGVSGWETVSERVVQPREDTSLAGILKGEGEDGKEGVLSKGVHKRKAEDEEDDEMTGRKRKVWGSSVKTFPGEDGDGDAGDLDALLSGVGAKKAKKDEKEQHSTPDGDGGDVKTEEAAEVKGEGEGEAEQKPLDDVPPPVVFKKRKVKK